MPSEDSGIGDRHYPVCPYCGSTLHDGDLDTEICGNCNALFEVTEDGVIFEGGVEAL